MPPKKIPDGTRHAICRLCSQPIVCKGKFGWYHSDLNMGAVHGVRPHYASPMAVPA